MRFALVTAQAGSPGTLATTAFVSALADGLTRIGVPVRVVGLVSWASGWLPESLDVAEAKAPWLDPPPIRMRDVVSAARLGVFDDEEDPSRLGQGDLPAWYLELLLERDLDAFAGGDELTVVAYPRSLEILRVLSRVTRRRGWRLMVQSSEALTDIQIDPATRDDYVKLVAAASDGVWALSAYLADYWANHGVSSDRILVQPNVVRARAFETDPEPARGSLAVYIGNLQHREVDYLLEIAQAVSQHVAEFRLGIYGDSSEERRAQIDSAIARLGLEAAVRIHPSVLPAEIPDVLRHADVLVLPRSQGEFSTAGFPNKLGEYLASARPVVVTSVGDIPTYLEDRRSALLVPPDDCAAFAGAVLETLAEPTVADSIGAEGRAVAADLLASPIVARRILEFAQGLGRPSRSGHASPARLASAFSAASGLLGMRAKAARARTVEWLRAFRHWLTWTPRGRTRVMAVKMALVDVMRALRLKPPAPPAQTPPAETPREQEDPRD